MKVQPLLGNIGFIILKIRTIPLSTYSKYFSWPPPYFSYHVNLLSHTYCVKYPWEILLSYRTDHITLAKNPSNASYLRRITPKVCSVLHNLHLLSIFSYVAFPSFSNPARASLPHRLCKEASSASGILSLVPWIIVCFTHASVEDVSKTINLFQGITKTVHLLQNFALSCNSYLHWYISMVCLFSDSHLLECNYEIKNYFLLSCTLNT